MLIGYDPEMLIHFRIFYDCYSGDFCYLVTDSNLM